MTSQAIAYDHSGVIMRQYFSVTLPDTHANKR